MPFGFVVSLVLLAILVLAALRPPRRPRWLALGSFYVGVGVSELPLLFLLYLAAMTALAVFGDQLLATPTGWVLLTLAALLAIALGYLQVRVSRARPALVAAMGESVSPTVSPWRSRFFPIPLQPHSVERIADLRYAAGGREHTLDLYRRRDLTAPAPVLLYFHGGGYFSGGKHREGRVLMHRMAARGWIVVSANYGLRPTVGFPEHLIDAKRVIAWVHREAHRYGMDAGTIVMSGSSAGAHLATLSALTPGDPAFQPGFEDVDTRLAAAVGLYGWYARYYGRPATEVPASTPLALDARDAPPVLLVHGDLDSYAPIEPARALAAHLRAASARPVVYAELPGAQHGFDFGASERAEAVVDGVELFLDRVLARGPSARRR